MANLSFFLFLLVGAFMIASAHEKKHYCCKSSPCNDMTVKDAIVSLWNIPKKQSVFMRQFKTAVLNLLDEADDDLIALLLAQSLWAFDAVTGFAPGIHPTCRYNELVKINKDLEAGGCYDRDKYDEAVTDYGDLCFEATDFSVYQGLLVAGCHPEKPKQSCAPKCELDIDALLAFLEENVSLYPNCLKKTIKRLLKSKNETDQLVAAAAIASGTRSNQKLFVNLLQREALLKTVQYKACNIKIPCKCCPVREEELVERVKALNKNTACNIGQITDDD